MDYTSRPQRNTRSQYSSKPSSRNGQGTLHRHPDNAAHLREDQDLQRDRPNFHSNMEDTYDEGPSQNMEAAKASEGRSLEDRMSIPNERRSEYRGSKSGADFSNGRAVAERISKEESMQSIGRDARHSTEHSPDTIDASRPGPSQLPVNGQEEGKGPAAVPVTELRQKVMESLAEKKKKAALFMNMEAEGVKEQSAESKPGSGSFAPGTVEAGNPERDAAVDALLATFGTTKSSTENEAELQTHSFQEGMMDERRDLSEYRIDARDYTSPEGANTRHVREHYTNDESVRRSSPRNDKQYQRNRSPGNSGRRPEFRDSLSSRSIHEGYRPRDVRLEARQRFDRYEDAPPSAKESKYAVGAGNDRKSSHDQHYQYTDDRRRHRVDEYKLSEYSQDERLKDGYTNSIKSSHRTQEPGVHDIDYKTNTEYASYPSGRYLPPREDPRYPPVSRPPETDYAALYYRDLTEWLEITGYHDYAYRQKILRGHQMRVAEENRRYALEEDADAQRYLPQSQVVASREDPDARRARGSSAYSMPPPPPPNGSWADREGAKRPIASSGLPRPSAYTTGSALDDRTRFLSENSGSPSTERSGLKRRISSRDDDIVDSTHTLPKSARHTYDNPHRRQSSTYNGEKPPYSGKAESIETAHASRRRSSLQAEEPIDETEAVRQSLSKRLAASRGREASPEHIGSRTFSRTFSPRRHLEDDDRTIKRDMSIIPINKYNRVESGHGSPEPSPRFEKDPYRTGRSASGKFTPRDEVRKSFRGRQSSLGRDLRSPVATESRASFDDSRRGHPYGRGRGRGRGRGYRDHIPYDKHERFDRRSVHGDSASAEGMPGFTSELRSADTRYFMIKSFNQDNVKMAQDDNIWATQQKNSEILEEAFNNSQQVILFFSINKSGKFQGYARMESAPGSAPVPSWAKNLIWESSGPFRIHWETIADISFHRVAHLKNQLNEGQPVLIGRDGQEIDARCGAALCEVFDQTAAFRKKHEEGA